MIINSARLFVSISIATLALATTAMTGCAAPATEDPLTGTSAALAAKKAADDKCGCDSSKDKSGSSKDVPDNGGKDEGSAGGKKVPGKDSGGDKYPSKEPGKDGSGSDCEDDDDGAYPGKDPGKDPGGKDEDDDSTPPDNCKDCDKPSSPK